MEPVPGFGPNAFMADALQLECRAANRERNALQAITFRMAGGRGAYEALPKAERLELRRRAREAYQGTEVPQRVLEAPDPFLTDLRTELRAQRAEQGNTQVRRRDGFVYAITNPAWPGYVKIGRCMDYEERLSSYQTGDPFRGYQLELAVYVADRHEAEKAAHGRLCDFRLDRSEWFHVSVGTARRVLRSFQK